MRKNADHILLGLIALFFAQTAWVSLHLGIDMFDTFEMFMNARTFAGRSDGWYYINRFYGLPLLLSPVFYIESFLGISDGSFAFVACHAVTTTMFGALLWICYRLF